MTSPMQMLYHLQRNYCRFSYVMTYINISKCVFNQGCGNSDHAQLIQPISFRTNLKNVNTILYFIKELIHVYCLSTMRA